MNRLIAASLATIGKRLLTIAVLLFVPAGSWQFQEAWVFLAVFFVPQFLIQFYLLKRDPALLQRRLKGGPRYEGRARQKGLMLLVLVSMALLFCVAGFDHRFHWSQVPAWLVRAADGVILLGFCVQFLAFRANTFGSIVIEVVPGQRVICSGPYALVRHPMYVGFGLTNLSAALAVGSWWAWPLALGWVVGTVLRLRDEEELLRQELPGYEEYCRKVPYRLIPGVI